jgi:hypothetical protein
VVYEDYLLQRLREELGRAQLSNDPNQRSVHERACQYYGELLDLLRKRRATTGMRLRR